MATSAGPMAMRAYLPLSLTRRLVDGGGDSNGAGSLEHTDVAVLFADISGFTPITEALAQVGARGTEHLAAVLDETFGLLIDEVLRHGGDVLSFAGDAMVAAFPVVDGDPGAAVTRAGAAALRTQAQLDGMPAGAGHELLLRMGIGWGGLSTVVLEAVEGLGSFMAAGDALAQAFDATARAAAGSVGVSPAAAQVAGARLELRADNPVCGTLIGIRDADAEVDRPLPQPDPGPSAERIAPFVPTVVRTRLAAHQDAFLSELRRVSVLFIQLPALDTDAPDLLALATKSYGMLQRTLSRYGGGVDKLVNDEKGTVALAAFGLPPRVYEGSPVRAVLAALELQASFAKAGLDCSLGVATGDVFCGTYGNDSRREFTVLGVAVNLAARLMAAASSEIYCDEATFQGARSRIRFAAPGPRRVKGVTGHVAVFRPIGIGDDLGSRSGARGGMIGRLPEDARLEQRLSLLLESGQGGVVIVEGEAGIGKSVLLDHLARIAREKGVGILRGNADAIERTTAWYPWRGVLEQLLMWRALPPGERPGSLAAVPANRSLAQDWVEAALASDPRLASWAPLLGDILPLGFPSNDTTDQMSGQARGDSLSEVLLGLLRHGLGSAPQLVILDDLHWFDSSSLAFALAVQRTLPRVLIVAGTRPPPEPLSRGLRDLFDLAGDDRLELDELSPEDTGALAARRLGVSALPPAATRLIQTKAGGHPLFSEELALALREAGVLRIVGDRAVLAPGVRDLDAVTLPDTVQGIITARINSLGAQEQLVLKVASVIGRYFSLKLLAAVHPVSADLPQLSTYVRALADAGLTLSDSAGSAEAAGSVESGQSWLFKHVIIQEVAYNLMLPRQRRQLHEAVGLQLEAGSVEEIDGNTALLAFHWSQTQDEDRAIGYLERAARQALQQNANAEAQRFFSLALKRDARRGSPSPLRRARWLEGIATARARLTAWEGVRESAVELLALVGHAYPRTQAAAALAIGWNILLQLLHRTIPALFPGTSGDEKEALLLASSGYALVANQAFMQSETVDLMLGCWRSLNLADRAGPSAELSRGLSNVGLILATMGMAKTSANYHDQAVAVAAGVGNDFEHAFAHEVAAVSAVHLTDGPRAERMVQGALDGFSRIGNQSLWEQTHSVIANHLLYVGELDRADGWWTALWAAAWPHGSPQHQALAASGFIASGLLRGSVDLELLERCDRIIDRGLPRVDRLRLSGLQALAWAEAGDPLRAVEAARRAEALIAEERPTVMYSMPGLASLFQYYRLSLLDDARGTMEPQQLLDGMAVVVDTLKILALMHRASKPVYTRLRGQLELARGRTGRARRSFQEALRLAEESGYVVDRGMGWLHLAELEPAGSAARAGHRATAGVLLEACGALAPLRRFDRWDAAQVQGGPTQDAQ